ncbi:hypothetical protein IAQ67_28560 (plasmid) [Paenibacillus peoriae]|uniref:Uncharacterized protein n=1 Tax=Paenibacillus peoriae TaxID=59893 RepID=A0A7H0YHA7_9BACL|nr:hypothetical protein [Paenibacillus peoriae]QNR70465.1 hypothetical protein IAQ67_28560 [Paenibacillus peoriae]
MSKLCTVKKAAEYLKEWAEMTAVKKESSDIGYHYFSAKDRAGDSQYIRVEKHADNEEQYNVFQRDDSMHWEWVDAITGKDTNCEGA